MRTHNCGQLRAEDVGKEVQLAGWVHSLRLHGGLIFVDLRDRWGKTQIVFNPEHSKTAFDIAKQLGREWVVAVSGHVVLRKARNPDLPTGDIEVLADSIEILNTALSPVFKIEDQAQISEVTSLKYRYLDLRRPKLQRALEFRHRIALAARQWLSQNGFIELETPILSIHTPEGAREYLVPSRVNLGKFYSLPQSPQLYKQLAMVAGFDKYFQFAKCFRDEDLRADRQPEFTQLDIELAFVSEEEIFTLVEGLLCHVFELAGIELKAPFKRLTWQEAMERYGTDKPDLRFGLELVEISFAAQHFNAKRLFALNIGKARQIDLQVQYAKVQNSSLGLDIPKPVQAKIIQKARAKEGDIIAIAPWERIQQLGLLRKAIGEQLKPKGWAPVWIWHCPLFEKRNRKLQPYHHPFTCPMLEDLPLLESQPEKVRARSYDLILNGWEIGGGSIRIHKRELQERIFRALGYSEEEAQRKFGFLLKAFQYGAPPHGGIALGFDRLVALMLGTGDIRDVIAFPKNKAAQGVMEGSPVPVSPEELRVLGIRLEKNAKP